MTYTYQRGETVTIFLESVDPAASLDGISVSAVLKKAINGGPPPQDAPVAAVFVVTPRAADADAGAGWMLTLSAEATASLLGTYVTNAVLTYAGGVVVKTDPLALTFQEATS